MNATPFVPLQTVQQAQLAIDALSSSARHQRVAWQGAHVHWRSWGTGPALVLLHGGHGSWLHWVRNLQALVHAGHTVWAPDMPGFGESDNPPGTGDYASLLDALTHTWRDALGPDTAVNLAGFSFGGLVAADLAANAAKRGLKLRRLALLGPGGHGGVRRQTLEMVNWRQANTPETLEAAFHNNLASLMLRHETSIDALALQVQARSGTATRFRSKSISRSAAIGERLQQIDLPTLLLWGEHDVTADPALVGPRLQALHAADNALHILPDCGHWVQYESAPDTNRLLSDWFR
jgi:pimeloyl-ACP methyl ester carboxylesterase